MTVHEAEGHVAIGSEVLSFAYQRENFTVVIRADLVRLVPPHEHSDLVGRLVF